MIGVGWETYAQRGPSGEQASAAPLADGRLQALLVRDLRDLKRQIAIIEMFGMHTVRVQRKTE
jgi:hypothetical protein